MLQIVSLIKNQINKKPQSLCVANEEYNVCLEPGKFFCLLFANLFEWIPF